MPKGDNLLCFSLNILFVLLYLRWILAVGGVFCKPVSESYSLLTGKNTGKIANSAYALGQKISVWCSNYASSSISCPIRAAFRTGIINLRIREQHFPDNGPPDPPPKAIKPEPLPYWGSR